MIEAGMENEDLTLYINRGEIMGDEDQTERPWVEKSSPNTLGTGLLLFKGPDSEDLNKAMVSNLTYGQFLSLLDGAKAGKWEPHWWASRKQVEDSVNQCR